ncbi:MULTISPECIES: hypothetical protein [Streptomyces]|uniref:Secreted protein n=2 Tax=Streptomyces TaxID=1883 RepID=A0ABV9IRT4_9ACTN
MKNGNSRNRIAAGFAAVTLVLGGAVVSASPATATATSASTAGTAAAAVPMDGPPGTVWTGKKFWTMSACVAAGTDLVSSGKWADPFCDGSGLQYDLWARPL